MLDCEILIVGAGPVGLTLALILKKFGVSFRIIDKQSSWSSKSKAMTITSRTLEVLNTLEVAEIMVRAGIPTYYLNYYYRNRKIGTADFSHLESKYNFILQISQSKTTQILNDKLLNTDAIIEREMELINFNRNEDCIICSIFDKKKGIYYKIKTRYLLACDGGHSSVRKFDNMDFNGEEHNETFLMADVTIKKLALPFDERHLFFLKKRSFLYIMPIERDKDNFIYRIITTEKSDQKFCDSYVLELFSDLMKSINFYDAVICDPKWISTFNPKQFVVNSFYENRVVYAGDAAHIQSPIGSQGLNTGIQDAFNVGWKVALTVLNRLRPSIMETYTDERLPIAHRLFHYNNKMSEVIFGNNATKRFLNIAQKRFLNFRRFNRKEIQNISQHKINYNFKNLTDIVGNRMPNFIMEDGRSVYDAISPTQFNLILFYNKYLDMDSYYKNTLIKVILVSKTKNKGLIYGHLGVCGYLIRPDTYIMKVLTSEDDLNILFTDFLPDFIMRDNEKICIRE